ncbi:hypothetical protein BVI2075_180221 [Burkholderia vietnamiensis]|nr:hypothetical protein BVI2075_180221 [Burkholderia vietnamiensis]CAG9201942.1 hypothetical protein BVI1335_1580024 [Burkholderia vietnamiensis]
MRVHAGAILTDYQSFPNTCGRSSYDRRNAVVHQAVT